MQRIAYSTPALIAGSSADFTITVGTPSAPWLSATGSVNYPVTVQSVNGQSGAVNLTVTGMPPGVSAQYQTQVALNSPPITLTFTGSATMPGGTYPLVITGTLGSLSRTATFSLGTQVTTFQGTSVIGSAIVHNNGQEAISTLNVPAGNAPTYTTCSSLDPAVTCRVVSTGASTVTLGITASRAAVHGTRVLLLNGGAATANAAILDWWPELGSIQADSNPPLVGSTITLNGSGFDPECGDGATCPYSTEVVATDAQGDLYQLSITSLSDTTITAIAPSYPGNYEVYVDICGYAWDDGDGGTVCDSNTEPVDFDAPPPPPPQLTCNSPATRGQTVTCAVSGSSAGAVSSWSFTGGGATVSGPSGTTTWSGTMVVGGTVTVNLAGSAPLQQSITVNARSWHTQPPNPVQVSGNVLTRADGTTITLAVPPVTFNDLGSVYYVEKYEYYLSLPISAGPNSGFGYYASAPTFPDLRFQYVINTDLQNQNSIFSQHQCGTGGYISWSDLLSGTIRHEAGTDTQNPRSHWAFWANSVNQNNLGDYLEGRVASPGTSLSSFDTATAAGLTALTAQNANDAGQPDLLAGYGLNYSSTGQFLGNVNFGPNYASCQ